MRALFWRDFCQDLFFPNRPQQNFSRGQNRKISPTNICHLEVLLLSQKKTPLAPPRSLKLHKNFDLFWWNVTLIVAWFYKSNYVYFFWHSFFYYQNQTKEPNFLIHGRVVSLLHIWSHMTDWIHWNLLSKTRQ